MEKIQKKRSRKEEQRILEIRRLRQIRIGPPPKQLKRMQNVFQMMEEIYSERLMKGKNKQSVKNEIVSDEILNKNKQEKSNSQIFYVDHKDKDDNEFNNQVDFRSIKLVQSPLVDETYENNQEFLFKTKQIRQAIYNSQLQPKPKKKKQFQIQENDENEINQALQSNNAQDKKKSRIQTIQERIEKQKQKQNQFLDSPRNSLLSPVSQSPNAKDKTWSSINKGFQIPFNDLLPEDLQSSLSLQKRESQTPQNQNNNSANQILEQNDMHRKKSKSLFHFEDTLLKSNFDSQSEFMPALLELKRKEAEMAELKKHKQKLEQRQDRIDDIRQKLGLMRQFELKNNIEKQINYIQKDLDKIDQNLSNIPNIRKFRVIQPRPLTFSKNDRYQNIKNQNKNEMKSNLIGALSDNQYNLNDMPINSSFNKILSPVNQNFQKIDLKSKKSSDSIFEENIIQLQNISQNAAFPSRRFSIPVLQFYNAEQFQKSPILSPNSKDNFSTEMQSIKQKHTQQLSNSSRNLLKENIKQSQNKILSIKDQNNKQLLFQDKQENKVPFDSIVQDKQINVLQKKQMNFSQRRYSIPVKKFDGSRPSSKLSLKDNNVSQTKGEQLNKSKSCQQLKSSQNLQNMLSQDLKINDILSSRSQRKSLYQSLKTNQQTFDFNSSPDTSTVSSAIKKDQKIFKFPLTSSSSAFSERKRQNAQNIEVRKKAGSLFQQVNQLQQQTREMAKEETDYVTKQTKIIAQDFMHWDQELQEYNTDADKTLFKDIQFEMKLRDKYIQELMHIS
ncbi:hypothetical protein TTHERM_00329840 (macronuclear) [Tetrahymena thermophila SB210]|uniref:Uncharacterized protein n=1 Tax=Tetrahymena thermophila (strain SB210) TaxID=312017 RepID=I7MMS3_TETTS|nr:hypothetical protein TTHERM_00329840 [Tetrahymena thermophila SB210]EAS06304.2 hypothetical protein TTHERM_00329840 [Tetrahymena thermophila SB210]|eukprot:XP_001026549.2 hypothetical protein TTHERM_00329840 [Tetrahymena thermophila SB210]